MGGGPQGFYKAPVSKALLSIITLAGVVSYALNRNRRGRPQFSVMRPFTAPFTFGSPAELVVGLILLYTFRQFERYMGSNRFSLLALFSSVMGASMEVAASAVFPSLGQLASGPYAFIFSLFILYHRSIPKLHPRYISVCGVTFSDKTFTYILGLQLMCNGGWNSAVPAFAGLASGLAFTSEALPFRNWTIPSVIANPCRTICMPLLASAPPGEAQRQRAVARQRRQQAAQWPRHMFGAPGAAAGGGGGAGAGGPGMAAPAGPGAAQPANGTAGGAVPPHLAAALNDPNMWQAMAANSQAFQPAVPVPPPSDEVVDSIVSMGFERDAVIAALRATQNNRGMAINRLLQGT